MRIPRILLLISLIAGGLCSQAPRPGLAQQPGTVSIRPRTAAQQPGVPTVQAVANRRRVPVGDEVTFKLSPPSVLNDPCYKVTLYYGDKSQDVMQRGQTQAVHSYQNRGDYTYSILVSPVGGCAAPPDIPQVSLVVTPSAVDVNQPVTFVAELSRPAKGLVYRFVFDDGSETGWQNDRKASHAYAAPKTYRPYVEIRFAASLAARPVVGSRRQSVEVRQPQKPITISVKLSANRRAASEKTPITFVAQAAASRPIRMQYRFDFGDQTAIQWQSSPQATHRYKPGNYRARVEVAPVIPSAAQAVISDWVTIEIDQPPPEKAVDLNVQPPTALVGVPIFFNAKARGADSQTRYRFHFGDNRTSAWSPQSTQTHAYASPRDYQASVEMKTADATVVSANRQVTILPIFPTPTPTPSPTPRRSPTPTPTGSPTPTPTGSATATPTGSATPTPTGSPTPAPTGSASATSSPTATATPPGAGQTGPPDWWPLILIPLLVLGAYKAAQYFLIPRPTFVPHADAGNAKASGLGLDFQVDVDPNVDGAFKIDTKGGGLIKGTRKSDD